MLLRNQNHQKTKRDNSYEKEGRKICFETTLITSTIVLAIIIIIGGHYYYQQKLQAIAEEAQQIDVDIIDNEEDKDKEPTVSDDDASTELPSATGMLNEWIEQYGTDGSLEIVAFGSTSITHEDVDLSWPYVLTDLLQSTAGNIDVNMHVVDVDRLNTFEIAESDYIDEVISLRPEVLLIEPFLLNDNGVLMKEDSIEMLRRILSHLEPELAETEIILLPGNPLFGAGYYLEQTQALEQFANDEDYIYADHWFAWPSTDDSELNNLIENARPNEQGHHVCRSVI